MLKNSKLGLIFFWSIIGVFSCILVSCSNHSLPEKPELQFWTMQLQPDFTIYFNRLITKFEQNNSDIKVKWVDIPWDAMESKILSSVSSNTAPDVVNLNPNFASLLASRGAWLDLNAHLSLSTIQQYLPKIWQANSLNQVTFGVPWYLTTDILFYNTEILSKAGLDQPPANYMELATVAKKIKEKTGKYAFFMTFLPGDSNEVLESLVQMGVQLFDSEGKSAFDSPEGIAAFKYWVDLYQGGILPPEVLTQGHREAVALYQSGQLAMLSTGAEFFKSIITNSPNIARITQSAPAITGKNGKRGVAIMNLVIPQDSKQISAAVKFALFVTNSQNQVEFAQAANVLPSTIEGLKQYEKALNTQKNNSGLARARQVSTQQLQSAEVLIPPRRGGDQLQKIIYENLQAAMLGEKTIESALKEAAQQWDLLVPN